MPTVMFVNFVCCFFSSAILGDMSLVNLYVIENKSYLQVRYVDSYLLNL